jgi:hypothetical protein
MISDRASTIANQQIKEPPPDEDIRPADPGEPEDEIGDEEEDDEMDDLDDVDELGDQKKSTKTQDEVIDRDSMR